MEENQTEKHIAELYDKNFWQSYFIWGGWRHNCFHYGYYDKKNKTHTKAVKNLNKKVAKTVKIKKNDHVFDAGCGIGGSAIYLADKFSANIVGVTLSEKQTEVAKRIAKRRGLEGKTEFFKVNYLESGFPDKSFDIAWVVESMLHASDKIDFLKEMHRLLKNNGKIVVADIFQKKIDLSEEEKEGIHKTEKGLKLAEIEQKDKFVSELSDTGFKNIKVEDITKNTMPSSRNVALMGRFGFRKKELNSALISQYKLFKSGAWGYYIITAEKT